MGPIKGKLQPKYRAEECRKFWWSMLVITILAAIGLTIGAPR